MCYASLSPDSQIWFTGISAKIFSQSIILSQVMETTSGSCAVTTKGLMEHCYDTCFLYGNKEKPWLRDFAILQWCQTDRLPCKIAHKILKGTWTQTQFKFQLDEPDGKIKEDKKGRLESGEGAEGQDASIFPPKLCQFDFWQTKVAFVIAFSNIPSFGTFIFAISLHLSSHYQQNCPNSLCLEASWLCSWEKTHPSHLQALPNQSFLTLGSFFPIRIVHTSHLLLEQTSPGWRGSE